jgi:hypothetical protein
MIRPAPKEASADPLARKRRVDALLDHFLGGCIRYGGPQSLRPGEPPRARLQPNPPPCPSFP